MAAKCTLCAHPDRAKIETMLVGGQSVREVSLATGVSRDVIMRHQAHADWSKLVAAQPADEPKPIKGAPTYLEFCENTLKIKFTRAQRILARVAFGDEDPIDLGDDADLALQMFGGVERFPTSCRRQEVLRLGRASAKSLMCVAFGLWRIEYADLSMVGPGDEACVVIVAPLKILSEADVNVGEALAKGTPSIAPRVRASNTQRVLIERRDGKKAQLLCVPKSGGGAAARGKSIIDAILDESEFLPPSADDAAVRDVDLISAMMPRLIPSGRLFLISTPWPVPSETSRLFKANYGHPVDALVARVSTAVMRAEHTAFLEMIAFERNRDPENARREYDCEETSVAGSFLDFATIERAVGAIEITRQRSSGGMDLAFSSDSAGFVMTERQAKVVVTAIELVSPSKEKALVPSEVVTQFATSAILGGCYVVAADQWYIHTAREVAVKLGVQIVDGPTHGQFELAMLYMRDLFRNGLIVLPPDPRLTDQLKSITATPRAGGGLAITLPRRIGMGHADLVPALCNALWLDRRFGSLVAAPTTMPSRGLGGGFQKW